MLCWHRSTSCWRPKVCIVVSGRGITTRWTGAAGACFASNLVRRRLKGIAPPGQLRRYLPPFMKVSRVVATYILSPVASGIYWLVLNWQLDGRDPQMLRDPLGIVSIFALFTVIRYVAERLLGTPLLCWLSRRGYSSLRSFLLGGVAIAIVVWLSTTLLYFQILREMSLVFNLMFLLIGCIVPVLLSTIVFWFVGGRQITSAWSGLAAE